MLYSHYTKEETKAQKLWYISFIRITQLVSARYKSKFSDSKSLILSTSVKCIYLLIQHLLNIYFAPKTMPGPRDTEMTKTRPCPAVFV